VKSLHGLQPEKPAHSTSDMADFSRIPERRRDDRPKPLRELRDWLKEQYFQSRLHVRRIGFRQSRQWQWDARGFLTHTTGRFFNVVGVRYVSLAQGTPRTQPIIDQSEIGLLCFLVCRENGAWWILGHAKVEPGNVNGAQLAPTVQATRSNYEVVHGGADTPYLSLAQSVESPLCDQLQSEQNSRFLAKRNCNRVVRLPRRVEELDARFRWLRAGALLALLGDSHLVNTDARSVLACWLFTDPSALRECLAGKHAWAARLADSLTSAQAVHATDAIEEWLETLNRTWKTDTQIIALRSLEAPWRCRDWEISSPDDPSLMIYQVAVDCVGREVTQWDQPIAGSRTRACAVLLLGDWKGTLHLLLQGVLEAGNRDGFELTTTVQAESCDRASPQEQRYLRLADASGRTVAHFENSEEGGRFDQCISEYRVVWVGPVQTEWEGPFHRWISLSQFSSFLRRGSRITNELRSAVSSLLSLDHGCE